MCVLGAGTEAQPTAVLEASGSLTAKDRQQRVDPAQVERLKVSSQDLVFVTAAVVVVVVVVVMMMMMMMTV
jgi:hypothetical protein